ncbi:hypothetical protein COOONC_08364 [Cooperia oncophora]
MCYGSRLSEIFLLNLAGYYSHKKGESARSFTISAPCYNVGVFGKCTNGGAPNPRDCNLCLCPNGYGGTLCGQRKAGCGGTLAATTAWKSRNITLGNNTITTIRETYTQCNDWITAPKNKTIQIRVTALKDVICANGCVYKLNRTKGYRRYRHD